MDERLNLLTEEEKQKIEAKVLYEEMLKAQIQQEQSKQREESSAVVSGPVRGGTEITYTSVLSDSMIDEYVVPMLSNALSVAYHYGTKKVKAITTKQKASSYAAGARELRKSKLGTIIFQVLHLAYVMWCFRIVFDPATFLDNISIKTYGEVYLYIIETILAKSSAGPFGKVWIIILCETILPLIVGYLLLTLFRVTMLLLRRGTCKKKAEKLFAEAQKLDEEAEDYRKENEDAFFMLPDRYQSEFGIGRIKTAFEQREALSYQDAFRICDEAYKQTFAHLGAFTVGKGFLTYRPFGNDYEERMYI